MMSKAEKLFPGIVFGLFLLIISAQLWTDGMFVDGVYYASIARNLSEGIGSFWKLSFSATHDAEFYGHPPLAIGIQSVFFKFFGDKFWVERIYSLFTYLVSCYFIIKIWVKVSGELNLSWIPLLLWLSVPTIQWAAANNILENTVTIFVLGALFSLLKAEEGKKTFLWMSIAGLFILCGFLSKGFTALFPLATPVISYLIFKKGGLVRAISSTIYILFWIVFPLILWMYLDAQVYEYLSTYFRIQVLDSIEGRVNVTSRWHIVIRMIEELLVPGMICLLFLGSGKLWRVSGRPGFSKNALRFSIIGLCGVVPVMVSMKQSGFYIVPAFPVLTLGMAFVLVPVGKVMMSKWKTKPGFFKFQLIFFSVIVAANVWLAFYLFGKTGRDQYFLDDWNIIKNELQPESTISVCLKEDHFLNIQTYMSRYEKISMEPQSEQTKDFLLLQKEILHDCNLDDYRLIPLPTSNFDLFTRVSEPIE